jgi:hypothetical protein
MSGMEGVGPTRSRTLRSFLAASSKGDRQYLPVRSSGERLQVIAVVNFKGGSGKTTTAAHLAQYLALRGYRILAVDLDPQASLSALHGVQPEFDIGENETLYGAIRYDEYAARHLSSSEFFSSFIMPIFASILSMIFFFSPRAARTLAPIRCQIISMFIV